MKGVEEAFKSAKTIIEANRIMSRLVECAERRLDDAIESIWSERRVAVHRIVLAEERARDVAWEKVWARHVPVLECGPKGSNPDYKKLVALPCYTILPPFSAEGLTSAQRGFLRKMYFLPQRLEAATLGELPDDYLGNSEFWPPHCRGMRPHLGAAAGYFISKCLEINGIDPTRSLKAVDESFKRDVLPFLDTSVIDFMKPIIGAKRTAALRRLVRLDVDEDGMIMFSKSDHPGREYRFQWYFSNVRRVTYRTREELLRPIVNPYVSFQFTAAEVDKIEEALKARGLCLKPS